MDRPVSILAFFGICVLILIALVAVLEHPYSVHTESSGRSGYGVEGCP